MQTLKVAAVVLSAVVLTTFAIDASDTLRGNSGTLVATFISAKTDGKCPPGMVRMLTASTYSCIDAYEASAKEECPFSEVSDEFGTVANIADSKCSADSKQGAKPWTYIAREQAALVCARAGKRLPTALEWYQAAIGTPDDTRCVVELTGTLSGGERPECRSAAGIYDAVGNVWEWVSDDVFASEHNGRVLPSEGYVIQTANDGIATETALQPSAQFGSDYMWSENDGNYGIIRGGFYNSGEDAGVYAVHAKTIPSTIGGAIGFRCVK